MAFILCCIQYFLRVYNWFHALKCNLLNTDDNDFHHSRCPDDKPHLCLPYGTCYGNDEFCFEGLVQTCFPLNIPTTNLKNWCETEGHLNVSFMRDGSCSLACASRFGSVTLKTGTFIVY